MDNDVYDPTFCDSGADLIIRSCDGYRFRVHSSILTISSLNFRSRLLQLRRTTGIIRFREHSDILRVLLLIIYPGHVYPPFDDFEFIKQLARAASKYGMSDVIGVIRSFFIHETYDFNLVEIYALACELDWENEIELFAWRIKKDKIDVLEEPHWGFLSSLDDKHTEKLFKVLSPHQLVDLRAFAVMGPQMDYRNHDERPDSDIDTSIRIFSRYNWWELLSTFRVHLCFFFYIHSLLLTCLPARRQYTCMEFPDADAVIIPEKDPSMKFYVHTTVLRLSSNVWRSQLKTNHAPVITFSGNAEVLKALLDIIYYPTYHCDVISPLQSSFDFLRELCYAARDIEASAAKRMTKRILKDYMDKTLNEENEDYYARHYGWTWEEACDLAFELSWKNELDEWVRELDDSTKASDDDR